MVRTNIGVIAVFIVCSCPISASGDDMSVIHPEEFLGGPASVPAEIDLVDDNTGAFLERLNTEYGLKLATDYTFMSQSANDVLTGDKHGTSGVYRLFGTWTLIGRGTRDRGSIVAKVEHRHAYSDTPPGGLASNTGYLGLSAIGFSDVGGFVGPLYWQQYFNDGKAGFIAGRVDPFDFIDVIGIGSQWTSFQNTSTLVNLAMPLLDPGCGAGGGQSFNDQWVVSATAHDMNGSQTSMDCFAEGLELYKTGSVAWSPSRAQRFAHAFQMTVWHADAMDATGQDSGQGIALSANWTLAARWMPFVRIGVSEGEAAAMKSQVSTGLTYTFGEYRSVIGAAVSLQKPRFSELDDQATIETYARFQVTPSIAISLNLQVLHSPALNSDHSNTLLGGMRVRYTPK